jgi:hypothetical protein
MLSVKLMSVANSKIVPGTHRRKLKSMLGFAIRHKHHIEDEPHAIWTEADAPLRSSTLRFDPVFILALSLVSRKKQSLLSS